MRHDYLPIAWKSGLSELEPVQINHGLSGANVVALAKDHLPVMYLKSEPDTPFSELPLEHVKLKWLAGKSIPCPTVRDFITENGQHWMLLTALPGRDLVHQSTLSALQIIDCVFESLQKLHSLDVVDCPFDMRLDHKIEQATDHMKAGLVDETDFDAERLGASVIDLHVDLTKSRPEQEKLVVAHGDACLPNLIVDGSTLSGFIDCGRLGVADQAQDIALAARSIEYNLGVRWRDRFLSRYGVAHDDPTLAYYRLLDEFF